MRIRCPAGPAPAVSTLIDAMRWRRSNGGWATATTCSRSTSVALTSRFHTPLRKATHWGRRAHAMRRTTAAAYQMAAGTSTTAASAPHG